MSHTLRYFVFLFFPFQQHCCPVGLICSDSFYWNPHVHCIVVENLLVNCQCLFPYNFARFSDSSLCFIPLLSSGISTLFVSKNLLIFWNSYIVQFLKTHVILTSIFQEWKPCLFKSIMFCSCCLIIAFGILINNNDYSEIMFFLVFSKLLPSLQLRRGETILVYPKMIWTLHM